MRLTALIPALVACVCAGPALAGRGLDEPPALGKAVRSAARADVDKALVAAAAAERCKDALTDPGLLGISCRATVAAALASAKPLDKPAALDARAALFNDVDHAAASVSSWQPLTPPPGLSRARFEAHRALSRALMSLYDDVNRAASAEAKAKAPSLKTAACNAVARTVELGGADASVEERGAAQGLLTSHSCFLDEGKLDVRPTPTALKGSTDPAALAATDVGAIVEYAASRAIDLQRCIDKHVSAALAVDDEPKTLACLCNSMSRWKTPKPRDTVSVALPLVADLRVRVHVSPAGAVDKCVALVRTQQP